MPAQLICDAPGCGAVAELDITSGMRVKPPGTWWALPGAVACCDQHLIQSKLVPEPAPSITHKA